MNRPHAATPTIGSGSLRRRGLAGLLLFALGLSSTTVLGGTPASAQAVEETTAGVGLAGQSWTKSAGGGTWGAAVGGAFYRIPTAVQGDHTVRFTLSSPSPWAGHVTLEDEVIPLPASTGPHAVAHVVSVTDGAMDLQLTTAPGVALWDLEVVPHEAATPQPDGQWQRVYRHDFSTLADVAAFQSSPTVNSSLAPGDTANSPLQRPTLAGNVAVVDDSGAQDGKALGVHTRLGTYKTLAGAAHHWTNGRMSIRGQEHAPPVRIRTRLRLTPSANTKSAVMWWPAGGGWPWEVDLVETFGGPSSTAGWGSRQKIAQRWHADLDGDGRATEQLVGDIPLDATQYHVFDLFITPDRMWMEVDGVTRMETTDRRYIPNSPGFFSIGKALTGRRDAAGRTDDAVIVDWVEIYRAR